MISGCNYSRNVRLLTGGSLDRENFVETVPFEFRKGLIVVQARVNNDTHLREFIFDTGAFDGKIEKGLSDSLNLPTKAYKTNSTAQGISRNIELTRLDSLFLGETPFVKTSAGKLEYDVNSASRCIAAHGLIGANLIKLAHWKIDFRGEMLSFSDSPISPLEHEDLYVVSFSHPMLSGTPSIELKVEDKTISPVLFDVGFNGGLILPKYLSAKFPTTDSTIIIDRSTTGIFGSSVDTLIVKTLTVNIGGFEQRIQVEFSSIGKSLLGTDFLKQFDIYMDYKKDLIGLQRNAITTVEIADILHFVPGMLNDSLWVVNRTVHDSSIQLGDTLRFVNGKRPSQIFSDYCEYVDGIGDFLNSQQISIETISGNRLNLTSF